MNLTLSPRIREAADQGGAVVVVESTLLTHGLSYPKCLELVLDIENEIRKGGAEPAVAAMLDGRIHVGLEREEMERIARDERRVKLTAADLAVAAVKGRSGGTTAATTAWIARKAGFRVALAGGLGGVHRDVAETWDISGDLTAMGEQPVMMVCGGIKTFLDIGKSLEALETLGVPVWAYCSDRFPGYFVRESAFRAPRIESAKQAAAMAAAHWDMGFSTGIVLGVPIPEAAAFGAEEIEGVIGRALEKAKGQTEGKGVTPLLIREIESYTQGRSAAANRALILEAARTAAEVAAAFAGVRRSMA
ncbi:pseudouridine-5'-phosphate glycosidase [Paenibacillaceae bacterium WGS1546]|uniref:pseudouridine-5'-phosphate glycosidase n=1 Tax=Cohnella sp. WGS1546 TaxID=3366810 RepID=UPI00372D43A7